MQGLNFIPDHTESDEIAVPYLEDARAEFAPFYSSNKTVAQAQADVTNALARLGAGVEAMVSGTYGLGEQRRLGYEVRFRWMGQAGVIRVAALPIRNPTAVRERQARVQALLNVAQWLQTLYTQQVFSPGSYPLLPHLLVDGQRTVVEALMQDKQMPMLPEPVRR